MLFYMYDMEAYRDEIRGFYLDVSTLPGPIVKSEGDLVKALKSIEAGSVCTDIIDSFNKEYNLMNDGNAAERLVNHIVQQ